MHEITTENLVLTARVAMVSQLGILYSLLLLEYFFMVQNQATSIQNPHINLVKQESLFLFFFFFFIWRNRVTQKLREWQCLGSNPELLSYVPQSVAAV